MVGSDFISFLSSFSTPSLSLNLTFLCQGLCYIQHGYQGLPWLLGHRKAPFNLISSHPLLLSRLPHDPMHAALSSLLMPCSSISKCFQISCSFQPLSLCARCSLCLEYTLVDSYSSAGPSCNFRQEALQPVLQCTLGFPTKSPFALSLSPASHEPSQCIVIACFTVRSVILGLRI